jgi:uncharacterized protein YjiK
MPRVTTGWIAPLTGSTSSSRGLTVAQFTPAQRFDTGVKEASDVVALPGGAMLVVSDTSDKVGLIGADGSRKKLKLEGLPKHKPSQFEGVAYDPVRHNLLLSREESREVLRYEWDPNKAQDPKLKHTYAYNGQLSGPLNKGLEGLAWVSAAQSPIGRAALIGAKEGKPRELVLFDDKGGGTPMSIKVDPAVRAVCQDVSAIGVDPVTGHLFISSDESSMVAQLELVRSGDRIEARLVQALPIKDDDGKPLKRIEGLTFNERGDLFVLTENDGVLRRFNRR